MLPFMSSIKLSGQLYLSYCQASIHGQKCNKCNKKFLLGLFCPYLFLQDHYFAAVNGHEISIEKAHALYGTSLL